MRKAKLAKKPGGIKSFENRVRPTTKIGGMRMGATRRMSNAFKGIKGRIPGWRCYHVGGCHICSWWFIESIAFGDQEGEAAGAAVGAGRG